MQKGAIEITGYITPTSETDTYPTHIDVYGKGGYRVVSNLSSLNNIPLARRSEGMLVYVIDINKLYKLTGGIDDSNWEEFISLPPLGTFTIAGITYPKIYVGTESGVPEASESFGYALIDILALNARFLTGNFIMADALFKPSYPGAQFINDLTDGILAKTGKTLRTAESGVDYVNIVDRSLCIEGSISTWLHDNNKTLRNTRVKIIEGTAQDGDDIQGIRTLIANAVISRGAITSDDSVFGLNNIGSRELRIYDRQNGAGRLTKSVNFISAYNLISDVNFYLPENPSSLGKVLADVGETIYDNRIFRKLDFVDIASNSAKYILQEANQSLPNAQALNLLGLGILKVNANGVLSLAISGTDYVSPIALEEETTARVEADTALETSIVAVQGELEAQITAITGFGSFALLTEFLANLGWTTGYSEYLWSKYRPLRTYNTYGDTDNYSKDGGNIWYDANHLGAAGSFKPGLRITSWDSSTVLANDLFPVSIGLFGYRNSLGQVGAQEGFVWQSYIENSNASANYRWPKNFGLYHVGHDDGAIGWNRKENLLMNYDYNSSSFSFEKKTVFKTDVVINYLNSGILKVTNGLIGLAIPDTDYATSELLEQIKTQTLGFRNEAETFATNALNSKNSAELSASNANTSAFNAYNSETSAQSSATNAYTSEIKAKVSEDAAKISETNSSISASNSQVNADTTELLKVQVEQIISQYLQGSMSTSIIDISWDVGGDPNEPRVLNNNFKKVTTLTTPSLSYIPKAAERFGVIDSSLLPLNPDVKSIYWQSFFDFGAEESVNANYQINFYHKLLAQILTPLKIDITSTGCVLNFNGNVNISNNYLYGLKKVGFGTGADITRAISLESFADINFGGVIAGKYNALKFNPIANIDSQNIIWDWGVYEGTMSLVNKLSNGNVYLPTFEYLISGQFSFGSMWGIASTVSNISPTDITGKFAIKFKNSSLSLNDDVMSFARVLDGYTCSLKSSLDMNSKPILNLAIHDNENSAVNKKFVIDYFASTPISIQLQGAVLGNLSNGVILTELSQPTFQSIITFIAQNLTITDFSSPLSNLDMNAKKIVNMATSGVDNEASNCKWVKDTIKSIQLAGAVTGTINNEFIAFTKIGSDPIVNNNILNLYFEDDALDPRYYEVCHNLPSSEDYMLPTFNFKLRAGTTASTNRGWGMKMKPGGHDVINGDFSIYMHHFLLPGDNTKDILKITADSATYTFTTTVNSILNLNSNKIINLSTSGGTNEAATCGFVNTAISNSSFPISLIGAVTGQGVTGQPMTTNFNPTQTISNSFNTQIWNFDRQLVGGDTIFIEKNILDSSNTAGNFIEKVSRSNGSTVQDVYYVEQSTIGNAMLWRKQFVTNTGVTYSPLTIIKGNNTNPIILLDADVNLNNKKLTSVGTGTLSTDGINKAQLDSKPLNTLPVNGDLDLGTYRASSSATPTSGNHLTNKTYVDTLIGGSGGGDWTYYTPTITCPSGTNPTLPAGNHYFGATYTVIGKTLFLNFKLLLLSAGTAGSGLYMFSLPPDFTIDQSKYGYDLNITLRNASQTGDLSNDGYFSDLFQTQVGNGVVRHGSSDATEVKVSPIVEQGKNKLALYSLFKTTTSQGFLMRNCYVNSSYFAFNVNDQAVYKFNATIKIL
jgi:hypothetical protein